MVRTLRAQGAFVLDAHSDAVHHRSVFTVTAPAEVLEAALTKLAQATLAIRLDVHDGVHPRLGGLDVCPIVPHELPIAGAVTLAHAVGRSIYRATDLPIYFYGEAALRNGTRELPDIRRGGLERLALRLRPDIGGPIDPVKGVVCVGARGPLIAFNVTLTGELSLAKSIAATLRESSGGLPGVRALAFPMKAETCQISMNLTRPELTGIDDAFEEIAAAARLAGTEVIGCEIVGLVPGRFLPDPNKQAARLLQQPGLSLETKLLSSSS